MIRTGLSVEKMSKQIRLVGAQHHQGGRGGHGGRGRGQGRGRGGHGGRGNGGRGSGLGRGDSNYIPADVLQKLDPKYRAMIFKGRDAMENESRARQVSATNKHDREEEKEDEGNEEAQEPKGGAAVRFGSIGNNRKRKQKGIESGKRKNGRAPTTMAKPNDKRARAELDSRAVTVCGGSTFKLHQATDQVVDVSGFHPGMNEMKNIQVGTLITRFGRSDHHCGVQSRFIF
mmetsp:Transcript_38880/g.90456  ORF Transcript_38880/g.90456 Transcript_38880/m.90456 type:complete len:230 (-) Transcript_38880:219-908(-)